MTLSVLVMWLLTVIILGAQIAVTIWVYKDAKVRNNEPLRWALITLSAPIGGIIVYLTIGRDIGKMSSNLRKSYRKKSSILLVLGVVILIGGGVTFAGSHNFASAQNQRGSFTFEGNGRGNRVSFGQMWNMIFNPDAVLGTSGDFLVNGNWTFSALSANGIATRTVRLDDNELANFHVDSTNMNGSMQLNISQNGNTKTKDITEGFNDYIDMSEFDSGRIEIALSFEDVEIVNTSISWR